MVVQIHQNPKQNTIREILLSRLYTSLPLIGLDDHSVISNGWKVFQVEIFMILVERLD